MWIFNFGKWIIIVVECFFKVYQELSFPVKVYKNYWNIQRGKYFMNLSRQSTNNEKIYPQLSNYEFLKLVKYKIYYISIILAIILAIILGHYNGERKFYRLNKNFIYLEVAAKQKYKINIEWKLEKNLST